MSWALAHPWLSLVLGILLIEMVRAVLIAWAATSKAWASAAQEWATTSRLAHVRPSHLRGVTKGAN